MKGSFFTIVIAGVCLSTSGVATNSTDLLDTAPSSPVSSLASTLSRNSEEPFEALAKEFDKELSTAKNSAVVRLAFSQFPPENQNLQELRALIALSHLAPGLCSGRHVYYRHVQCLITLSQKLPGAEDLERAASLLSRLHPRCRAEAVPLIPGAVQFSRDPTFLGECLTNLGFPSALHVLMWINHMFTQHGPLPQSDDTSSWESSHDYDGLYKFLLCCELDLHSPLSNSPESLLIPLFQSRDLLRASQGLRDLATSLQKEEDPWRQVTLLKLINPFEPIRMKADIDLMRHRGLLNATNGFHPHQRYNAVLRIRAREMNIMRTLPTHFLQPETLSKLRTLPLEHLLTLEAYFTSPLMNQALAGPALDMIFHGLSMPHMKNVPLMIQTICLNVKDLMQDPTKKQ